MVFNQQRTSFRKWIPKHSAHPKPLHPRSDMTTSSHLTDAPASPKSPRKHEQFDHPMSSPLLGNTTHGVGHHRPKAVVAAPMGGPAAPPDPPHAMLAKTTSEATDSPWQHVFVSIACVGKGRGCGGGGLLACKGGAKSSKQYSPIEHICQILTWQGETSTCPRSHNGP